MTSAALYDNQTADTLMHTYSTSYIVLISSRAIELLVFTSLILTLFLKISEFIGGLFWVLFASNQIIFFVVFVRHSVHY